MNLRLKSKLTEKRIDGKTLAVLWECNVNTVYSKLNGLTIITCEEFTKAALEYKFTDADVLYILFGPRYQ